MARLLRDTPATAIPAGSIVSLPAGLDLHITQTLGGNITVRTDQGLFQISRDHSSAIEGYAPAAQVAERASVSPADSGPFNEKSVWAALRTCFDPEIPVNIVDLGLVYDLAIEDTPTGRHSVQVKMTLTAPGCGMGPAIAEDARQKIAALPSVESAQVAIVWDPVWSPQMISAEGRKVLGLE